MFEEETAQAFLIVEGMGLGWQATGHGGRGAAALLGDCAAEGVKHRAPNPPTTPTRGEEEPTVVSIVTSWITSGKRRRL